MKISSLAFMDTKPIPSEYAYKTGNSSPPLQIDNVPEDTVSLALIVHDPDAPSTDFTHWVFWNLLPDSTTIGKEEVPAEVVEGQNDFGNNHWDGPAPPSGTHRYVFSLYALDTLLDLPLEASRYELEEAMEDHIIDTAELVGTYTAK